MPILIQADDLTGAADCAARCRHAGLPATIALRPPSGAWLGGVCALSSDSAGSRRIWPRSACVR